MVPSLPQYKKLSIFYRIDALSNLVRSLGSPAEQVNWAGRDLFAAEAAARPRQENERTLTSESIDLIQPSPKWKTL